MGGREVETTMVCQYLNTKKEAACLKGVRNCFGGRTKQAYTAAEGGMPIHMISGLKMEQ